jgi:hypothetical protein
MVLVERSLVNQEELRMAVSEFQRTIMTLLGRQSMSIANLAKHTGYNPLLLDSLIAGESREIPVDFFIRVADALDLTTGEKDELVRSWAIGIERRSWRVYSA